MPSSPAVPTDQMRSSDLTRLCLPQEFRDDTRKLAWVNSVCLLFLIVGVVGLKSPRGESPPGGPSREVVPVVLVAAEPPPARRVTEEPPPLEPLADAPMEKPVVAAVAAAVDTVAFAVPVAGPATLGLARLAVAGPATNRIASAPRSTPYVPSEADWGGHKLEYPPLASRRGYQGKVVLEILVAPDGSVSSVKVAESSGYKILDDAAVAHVQRHLRLRQPPGETRRHTLDMVFQLTP